MDYITRNAREGDLPGILENWGLCFGDPDELSGAILRCCGLYSTALVAEAEGRIVGCAFAFDGLNLPAGKSSYLYAICSHPLFRGKGIGTALTMAAAKAAFDRGAELVCLRPADSELTRWYACMGFRPGCGLEDERIPAFDGKLPAVEKLDLEEYLRLRGGSAPSGELLRAQDLLFRQDGSGGFYRVDGHIFCAENRWYTLLIRESNCPADALPPAAAALAKLYDMAHAHLLRHAEPDTDGELLMYMLPGGGSPAEPQDLFFPFTLD